MNTIPTRKISETLLEFAEPLLQQLPNEYPKSELDAAIKLATCVWNACVLDQWHKTTEYTDALRQQAAGGYEKEIRDRSQQQTTIGIVLALIDRKRRLYGSDPRGITNGVITTTNGGLSFRAEARLDICNISAVGGAQ